MLALLISEIEFFIGIVLVLVFLSLVFLITVKMTKIFLKSILRILLNSFFALVALFILNLIGIKVPIITPVLISLALFGLPALATILILLLFGVKIG